jgi:MFS family permease
MVTLSEPRRSDSGHRRPLLTVFLGWLWVMTGVNVAAPLYSLYADRFGFGSMVLTTVFATYAVTLVATLLVGGRVADRFGRRPALLAGLAVAASAAVLFALATGTGWLYAARALQGVAVGLISGPATAALVEIDPRRDERRPALLAGLAQAAGSGLGPLVGGGLARWAPDPLRACFVVVLVGTVVAAVFTWLLPEPGERTAEPWRPQWPRVPAEIRGSFARVSLSAGLVWATLALYLSVVPSYVAALLSTGNLALLGGNSALACGASAATQVVAQRRARGRAGERGRQALGLWLLTIGLLLLVASAALQALVIVLLAAVVIGVGHGMAFLDAQDELNSLAPPHRRAEVTAAFVCVVYVVVGGAVVAVGLLGDGVALTTAVGVVGLVLAVAAASVAVWQLRVRAGAPTGART